MKAYLLCLPRATGNLKQHLAGVEKSLKACLGRACPGVRFESWPENPKCSEKDPPLVILFCSQGGIATEFAEAAPSEIRGSAQRVILVVIQDDEHTKWGRSTFPKDIHLRGVVNVHVVPMHHELHRQGQRLCPRNMEALQDIAFLLQEKGVIFRPHGWDESQYNVGIVGKSGVGKSTLINTYFGFTPGQSEAASSGVVETTGVAARYSVRGSQVALWDTPGFGTQKMPEDDEYFRKVFFHLFDFYILVSASKVNEFEQKVYEKIEEMGKGCFYLRTRMDQAIKNEKRAHPRTFNQEDTIKGIRDKVRDALPSAKVWIVSGINSEAFDFPKMKELLPMAAASSADEHRKKMAQGGDAVKGNESCTLL